VSERSDKGTTRVVQRDLIILEWITEQYAIRLDHLQILLARSSTRTPKAAVSSRAATKVINRWTRHGWVDYQNILYGAANPPWIWLTHPGLRDLGYPFRYYKPALSSLNHIHAVNLVRLAIEAKLSAQDFQWRSERLLRYEQPDLDHYPDAEILMQGQRIGIEVELTQKTKRRVEDLTKKLAGMDYAAVWYFVDNSTESLVKRAVGSRKGFDIRNLSSISPYG
jgi:hypothetical protein